MWEGELSPLLWKPTETEGTMELEDPHLATITEVADSSGSHQWVSQRWRSDEEEGSGTFVIRTPPHEILASCGEGEFKAREPERRRLDQVIKGNVTGASITCLLTRCAGRNTAWFLSRSC